MLQHTKRQVFKIKVFSDMRCLVMFVTAVCLLLSDDVIPMTSSVNVGKRQSDGIFGIFRVTM